MAPLAAPCMNRALAAEKLLVVASFSILADMARQVGGDLIQVEVIVPADTDAHVWQPTAAASRALAGASVLIENGLGFEGWMSRLALASGFGGRHVVATEKVTPRLMREGALASTDPHAWQDARNGVLYLRAIEAGLAAADPGRAAAYRANADRAVAEVEATDRWIAGRFAPIPPAARRIITTHDAFGYYGDRYGIAFLAAQGLSTEAEPSAKSIRALVAQMKREGARAVFPENMTDPRLARMLAREAGVTVSGPLYADALSAPDGPAPHYVAMLRYNTGQFARAMMPPR